MPIHNLNHVNMFLQVIASGSISSAARILRKSHTAVSSAVSNLEIDLCVELVRRDGYKVEPTEQALRLIPYMRSLLNYQQLIGDIAFNLNNKGPRNLRVLLDTAIPPSFCDTVSSVLLDDFNMVSLIRTSPADSLATIKQDNAEIDIAITIDEELKISRFNQCVLGYTKAFVVAHPQHPLCNASLHSIASLANYRQISLGSRPGSIRTCCGRSATRCSSWKTSTTCCVWWKPASDGASRRIISSRNACATVPWQSSANSTNRAASTPSVLLLQHRAGIRAQLPALSRKRPPAPARTGPPAFRRCAGLATEHRRNGAAPLRPEGARVPPARRTRERSPADAGRGW